jgi:DNA polymerase III alpha subunit (gram-positive type)
MPINRLPEIVEFCGITLNLETGEILKEIDTLIKPSKSVTEETTKITGLRDEDLEGAGAFADKKDGIRNLIESAPLVIAHNLSYDKEMIDIEYERLGETIRWPRLLCTVEATIYLKGYRMNLTGLHEYLFGTGFPSAHRARNDVEALVRCCVELHKRGEI